MKHFAFFLAIVLVAGCNAAPESPSPAANAPAPANEPASAVKAPMATDAKRATATGVVQSVDVAAQVVSIAHGPVESLGWPGMTMNFKAPGVDLSPIKAGDEVEFEFTSTGMDGTIESISKR